MAILGLDPGDTRTGWIVWDPEQARIVEMCQASGGKQDNVEVLGVLSRLCEAEGTLSIAGIENISIYPTPSGRVSNSVPNTCIWIGRFVERLAGYGVQSVLLYRKTVTSYVCQSSRAKDLDVITSLKTLYGEKGTKKNPGRLYGISGDTWSALAVAVTLAGYIAHGELSNLCER